MDENRESECIRYFIANADSICSALSAEDLEALKSSVDAEYQDRFAFLEG